LYRPVLAVNSGKVDLCFPVMYTVGQDLNEHRAAGIFYDFLYPCLIFVIELFRTPERRNKLGLEIPAGLPTNRELFLETFHCLWHIGTQRVHIGHRKSAKTLQTDYFTFLFMPERVGRELVHL